jgi:hypothetical protein
MIEEQLNLFGCERPCQCGCPCNCSDECPPEGCLYSEEVVAEQGRAFEDDDMIDDMLDELAQEEHDDDVRLAIAHDGVRELAINVVEVLATYDRIDMDDENIFIPRPTIDRETAQNLYNKLVSVHSCLNTVRKNRQDT